MDAQSAYDSMDCSYLREVLKAYGFAMAFLCIFEVIYSYCDAVITINGHLSEPFKLEISVKQGDKLRCSFFVLAMDMDQGFCSYLGRYPPVPVVKTTFTQHPPQFRALGTPENLPLCIVLNSIPACLHGQAPNKILTSSCFD